MSGRAELRYRWRKTWPDSEDDFIGRDGSETIGRFYKHRAAEGMRWYWHMQWGANGRERVQLSGLCVEPREAARITLNLKGCLYIGLKPLDSDVTSAEPPV